MYKECDNLENLIIDNKKLYKDVETQVDLTKFSIETPARLLEFPNEKRVAWETLKNIREILKKINE